MYLIRYMFIVCCKYTNIYYKLCIYWIFFIISLFNSVFGEVKGGRYFTTTTLLISDLSPVSPKNLIKREKNKLVCSSEREDFIKIESTTKFAKIRIANLIPIHFVVPKCSLSYQKVVLFLNPSIKMALFSYETCFYVVRS